MRKIIPLILFFAVHISISQNKQVLYGFAELPQTLLLNPGAETNYKFHIGVPLLSGVSLEASSTGFNLSDLFLNDNIPFNTKVSNVLNKLNTRDHIKLNTQIEVFNGGYRYNDSYFSFGFYQELDAIGYLPKDIIALIIEGNASNIGRSFNFSQINYRLDVIGALHFGVSHKINENLTIGGRFKLYSSALNMRSKNNRGTFTTEQGSNIYTYYLENFDADFKTSGLVENNEYIIDFSTYLGSTFFGSNLGIGLDFGFTYHLSNQLELTASILDFGFIRHKKNVKNTTINGGYVFEGIEFDYENPNPNLWNEFDADIRAKLPVKDNDLSYTLWRPTKINSSIRYSFGKKTSKYCYDNTFKDFYKYAVGAQLFSVFRPLGPQIALTGFYEARLSDNFQTKITYTLDDYSLYNIGVGVSSSIGKFNIFGMVDNLAQINNIASANSISFQLGMNLIF